MEPLYVEPLTEDQLNESHSSDEEETIEDDIQASVVHTNILKAVTELKLGIYALKRKMFSSYVSFDEKHSPGDMGSLMTFHSLFLQTLGYWIGLLDSKPVPPPKLSKTLAKELKSLTDAIEIVSGKDSDARVLVYNLLFSFSTQHPYDLGEDENSEEE